MYLINKKILFQFSGETKAELLKKIVKFIKNSPEIDSYIEEENESYKVLAEKLYTTPDFIKSTLEWAEISQNPINLDSEYSFYYDGTINIFYECKTPCEVKKHIIDHEKKWMLTGEDLEACKAKFQNKIYYVRYNDKLGYNMLLAGEVEENEITPSKAYKYNF